MRWVIIKDRRVGVSWGPRGESSVWIASRRKQRFWRRFMWRRHDSLFIAFMRFRLRIMKPWRPR